jgi:pseudouridylate synthase
MIEISEAVREAIMHDRPVVALETTIFSTLGLPRPANADALARCMAAIADYGAVPALTAVLDGVARVGLDPSEHERVLGEARKVAERDVGIAVAQRWEFGATTVSASLALAAAAGVRVFATGGIGGVHRGSEETADVSADLGALARHPVVCVCAGAKSFLDLPRTVEVLETLGVPVLGWRTDTFPAFYARTSGVPVAHRIESAVEAADAFAARIVPERGVLVTVPIPPDAAIDAQELDDAVAAALSDAAAAGSRGPAVTPLVLARIAEVTEGRSVPANLALAEENARVAAQIAAAVSEGRATATT